MLKIKNNMLKNIGFNSFFQYVDAVSACRLPVVGEIHHAALCCHYSDALVCEGKSYPTNAVHGTIQAGKSQVKAGIGKMSATVPRKTPYKIRERLSEADRQKSGLDNWQYANHP